MALNVVTTGEFLLESSFYLVASIRPPGQTCQLVSQIPPTVQLWTSLDSYMYVSMVEFISGLYTYWFGYIGYVSRNKCVLSFETVS